MQKKIEEVYNEALCLLEIKLFDLIGKTVADFNLPPARLSPDLTENSPEELIYDQAYLKQFILDNEPKLLAEQKIIYNSIIQNFDKQCQNLYFLDAPGGTGKTFLLNLIIAKLRSLNKTVIPVASSGIAAILLQGGKTAHSVFKIPLNISHQEHPVCDIKNGSYAAELLKKCDVIIWDECAMSDKKCIEALDRTLRDLRRSNEIMGGLTFIFAGDFRQT